MGFSEGSTGGLCKRRIVASVDTLVCHVSSFAVRIRGPATGSLPSPGNAIGFKSDRVWGRGTGSVPDRATAPVPVDTAGRDPGPAAEQGDKRDLTPAAGRVEAPEPVRARAGCRPGERMSGLSLGNPSLAQVLLGVESQKSNRIGTQ